MSFTDKKAQLQQKQMLKMADENIALRKHIAELKARIERIRELHSHNYSEAYECGDGCCWNPKVDECSECMDAYPCETLKILVGE